MMEEIFQGFLHEMTNTQKVYHSKTSNRNAQRDKH